MPKDDIDFIVVEIDEDPVYSDMVRDYLRREREILIIREQPRAELELPLVPIPLFPEDEKKESEDADRGVTVIQIL